MGTYYRPVEYSYEQKIQIEQYKKLYSTINNTVIFLSKELRCIYTSDEEIFPAGANILSYSQDMFDYPLKKFIEIRILRKQHCYCLRLLPVMDNANEPWLYIGELIDTASAVEISQRTDITSTLIPIFDAMSFNTAGIWIASAEAEKQLKESGNYDTLAKLYEIDRCTANIASVSKNFSEYVNMMHHAPSPRSIDAAALCQYLVDKCNAALAKCGRSVDLVLEPDDLQIYVDYHRCLVALVNAIQNALMYSPIDTVPVISVYRTTDDEHRRRIAITVTNINIMFTKQDFIDSTDVNFSYQRIGFGLPLIKRFVQDSNGKFDMDISCGMAKMTITLPAATESMGPKLEVQHSQIHEYQTSTPDFITIKMYEVVNFFGETDKNH